jgi:transcriptional antiterminator RfaH
MPYWSVARVQPKRESFAAGHLETRGFEVFLPKIETRRTVEPLLAGYLFVRIIDRWRLIETTFGVLCLIRVGDCPSRCPDFEIESLKARTDKTGLVRLPRPPAGRGFAKGEKIRILAGQFAHFDAIHTGFTAKARELVLINVLGAQREVGVPRHLIAQ